MLPAALLTPGALPLAVSYCKPVAAAPLVGSSGAPPTDTTGAQRTCLAHMQAPAVVSAPLICRLPPLPAGDGQEQGYAVGAWVYDSSHKTSRGWGEIMGAAPAAADGTLRWRVKFDRGARICAIKQTYLALPCVPYYERVPAAAVGQRVKVAVGEHSGKEGITTAFQTAQACTERLRLPLLPLDAASMLLHLPPTDSCPPVLCRAATAGRASLMAPAVR